MAWIERDIKDHLVPIPLLQEGMQPLLDKIVQGHAQVSL